MAIQVNYTDYIPGSNNFTWGNMLKRRGYIAPPTANNYNSSDYYSNLIPDATDIDNHNGEDIYSNILLLVEKILEPLAVQFPNALNINSGYRPDDDGSQHAKGKAADVDRKPANKTTNHDVFYYIKDTLIDFDQLIWELKTGPDGIIRGSDPPGEPWWVHVSYAGAQNRKSVFSLLDSNPNKVNDWTDQGSTSTDRKSGV
jgi:hypothetical protein